MDGKILKYEAAGCTDFEFDLAATWPCLTAAESRAIYGTESFSGTIDRSGTQAPRTPDWKFVVDLDYWMPMFDTYKLILGTKTTFSDGYFKDVTGFSEVNAYSQRVIANLNAGYGDLDDTWSLSFYARNIFNAGVEYFPEFNPAQDWIQSQNLSARNWKSYGVQFQYKYN